MTIPATCPQKSRPTGCPLDWPRELSCHLLWGAGNPACLSCDVEYSPRDPAKCRANVSEEAPVCLRCSVGHELARANAGKRRADAARSGR